LFDYLELDLLVAVQKAASFSALQHNAIARPSVCPPTVRQASNKVAVGKTNFFLYSFKRQYLENGRRYVQSYL